MAGAMRKAMVYLGLVEDEDRLEYDDYDQYDRDGEGESGHPDDRHDGRAPAGSGDGPRSLAASLRVLRQELSDVPPPPPVQRTSRR